MTKPTARARRTRVRDGSSSRCWHQGGALARPHPKDRTGGRGVAGNDAGDDLARRRTHGLIGEEATEHGRAKRRRGNGVELTAGSLAVSLGSGRPLRRRIRPRGSPDINGDEDDGGGVLLLLELRASTRRGRAGRQSSGIRWLDEGVSVATVDGDGGDGRARWA